MIILVDAMGGDNAPASVVDGCIDAINESEGFDIHLIGDTAVLDEMLKQRNFSSPRLKLIHADEVILNEDIPTKAIKNKKQSSMVIGFRLLKEGSGDVFVSAGNTGALLTGGALILGRFKGIDRPALTSMVPNKKGTYNLLLDAGANTMCKSENYLQFAIMGSIYYRSAFKVDNPVVGLLNVGVEETKGTDTVKQAFNLLKASKVNFKGNIEARELLDGNVNIVVCDGFVGNVVIKLLEGTGEFFFGALKKIFMSNIPTKISALLIKKSLKAFSRRLDPEEYGGVPLLGVKGKVVKCHGSSHARAIKNAVVNVACNYAAGNVIEQIRDELKDMEVEDIEQTQ